MANNKQRYINTRFWNDNFVSELNPIDKLLFIYFLTNEHTNISGIYELPIKIMSVETGIELSMIKKMLPRLNGKVRYLDGKVIIRNFAKHQETKSPLVKKGIINCLKDLDKKWLETIISKGYYLLNQEYTDTLCIPYVYSLNYSNLDLDLDSNSISEASSQDKKTKHNPLGGEILKAFEEIDPKNKTYYGNTTQRKACDFLLEEYGLEEVLKRITVLSKTNKIPYFPTINTPYDLKEKWVKLNDAVDKKRRESKTLEDKYPII